MALGGLQNEADAQRWLQDQLEQPNVIPIQAVNGLGGQLKTPAARVYKGSAQTITTATETVLNFDNERYDTDTIHDTVTNNGRLTCKTAGVYGIFATVQWDTNGTGRRYAFIAVNGATSANGICIDEKVTAAGAFISHPLSTQYKLAVNDYVQVVVFQASGGNLNILAPGSGYTPEFGMTRIGG